MQNGLLPIAIVSVIADWPILLHCFNSITKAVGFWFLSNPKSITSALLEQEGILYSKKIYKLCNLILLFKTLASTIKEFFHELTSLSEGRESKICLKLLVKIFKILHLLHYLNIHQL